MEEARRFSPEKKEESRALGRDRERREGERDDEVNLKLGVTEPLRPWLWDGLGSGVKGRRVWSDMFARSSRRQEIRQLPLMDLTFKKRQPSMAQIRRLRPGRFVSTLFRAPYGWRAEHTHAAAETSGGPPATLAPPRPLSAQGVMVPDS